MGNLHKAKALALQGIKRAPNHPALWTVAALVEDRLGEHARARNLLESGINRFSDHGPLYKVLGEHGAIESRIAFGPARPMELGQKCWNIFEAANQSCRMLRSMGRRGACVAVYIQPFWSIITK